VRTDLCPQINEHQKDWHQCHGVTLHRCNPTLDLSSEASYLITVEGGGAEGCVMDDVCCSGPSGSIGSDGGKGSVHGEAVRVKTAS
jgi:hypothetical protein